MKTKIILFFLSLFPILAFSQNSMVGDGFGGRLWYKPSNIASGSYSGYIVCSATKQLYGWGDNYYGQLGDGSTTSTSTPVAAIGMTNVAYYSPGYTMGAIKSDSSGWAWGNDFFGEYGLGSGFTSTPQLVISDGVKFVDAGIDLISFVKNDGTVWSVGNNGNGAFGDSTSTDPLFGSPTTTPTQMTGITDAVRVAVFGYNYYGTANNGIVVLKADGTVVQTGGGDTPGGFSSLQDSNTITAVTVPGLSNVIDVKANQAAAFALTSSGDVYVWGEDPDVDPSNMGTLGLGSTLVTYTPTKISFPVGAKPIVAISTQDDGVATLALDEDGNVYGWGYNVNGVLGSGDYLNKLTPVLVATNVLDINCGETFSYILKNDYTLWATGSTHWDPFRLPPTSSASIWMDLTNVTRNTFTEVHPYTPPMDLCPLIVLPVNLLAFSATSKKNNDVLLNWKVGVENGISSYDVEFSKDGIQFSKVGSVKANNNSNYSFTHSGIDESPIVYYKLKTVDIDNSVQYSNTLRVVRNIKGSEFSISPNPVVNQLTISGFSNSGKLQIIDLSGKVLLEQQNIQQKDISVDISLLQAGIYFLKYSDSEKTKYEKIIKK